MAEKLIRDGKSLRFVAKAVGLTTASVIKYRKAMNIEVLCQCGLNSKHQGWCKYRFKTSRMRQNTLAEMHEKQRKSFLKTRTCKR